VPDITEAIEPEGVGDAHDVGRVLLDAVAARRVLAVASPSQIHHDAAIAVAEPLDDAVPRVVGAGVAVDRGSPRPLSSTKNSMSFTRILGMAFSWGGRGVVGTPAIVRARLPCVAPCRGLDDPVRASPGRASVRIQGQAFGPVARGRRRPEGPTMHPPSE
jgi:hypothetical protein